MRVQKTKPEKDKAFGLLAISESSDGTLAVNCELPDSDSFSPAVMENIRFVLAGLAYSYEQDTEYYSTLGRAYLNGMEDAIRNMQAQEEAKKSKVSADTPTIGFHGKLKNDK